MIHRWDPDMAPDSAFEPGDLRHLVVGNSGRMLDPRRTPVSIVGLLEDIGMFELEVMDFEDEGARWQIPLEDIGHFQFAEGSRAVGPDALATYRETIRRFDRPLSIACRADAARRTRRALSAERERSRRWLQAHSRFAAESGTLDLDSRAGEPLLYADLAAYLQSQDLWGLETEFAARYVSNPNSGELVKGHRIVLAEMGLSPYEGKVIRDRTLFDEPWTKQRRTAHILARMAFIQEVFSGAGYDHVVLYRALNTEGSLRPARNASFTSATFSREVAESLFASRPDTNTAVLYRQPVPIERLFMTYIETEPMNRQFKEAEAILLADPGSRAF